MARKKKTVQAEADLDVKVNIDELQPLDPEPIEIGDIEKPEPVTVETVPILARSLGLRSPQDDNHAVKTFLFVSQAITAAGTGGATQIDTQQPVVSFSIPDRTYSRIDELEVDIQPIQSGSGTPAPDNVRPISGRDSVSVFDDPAHGGAVNWNQIWITDPSAYTLIYASLSFSNDEFTFSVAATNNARKFARRSILTPGHKYYVCAESINNCSNNVSVVEGTATSTDISPRNSILTWNYGTSAYEKKSAIFTASGNAVAFMINASDRTVGLYAKYKNVMLCDLTAMFGAGNEPSTVSEFTELFYKDYYAYNAGGTLSTVSAVNGDPYRQVTITLPQTVYGGMLEVTRGKLTVTHELIASYNGEPLPGEWISDRDVYAEGTTPTIGAQVVYELETPIILHLTPVGSIPLFEGQNNIFADTGDILRISYSYENMI